MDPFNCYFSLHAKVVFGRHVTLDKYISDAIMAFWSAPMDQPDHTCRAQRRFNDHGLVTPKGKEGKVHLRAPVWELS